VADAFKFLNSIILNFHFRETAERNRRISEHETDVKIQTETMQMLTKYGYYDSKGPKLQTLDIKNEKRSNKDRNSESESEENGT
jgi:hypothetical protein